jgi:molybdopterin-guanine dinucleotide biosynthesis protein A
VAAHLPASAVLLAGGRSSRIGRDKALLRFGEKTLLERLVAELRLVVDEVVLVLAPPTETESNSALEKLISVLELRVVRDSIPFQGPVSALGRGITVTGSDLSFACSCDLPLLRADVVSALCTMIGDHEAVVPRIGGELQPLHAVYKKSCATALCRMIECEEKRLQKVVEFVDARIVEEAEIVGHDPKLELSGLESFFNLNTERDYTRALELVSARKL